jgi:diguanylate cyclase (GGDEF)-like protein
LILFEWLEKNQNMDGIKMKQHIKIPPESMMGKGKFLFDILKETCEEYLFVYDAQANITMLSPKLVQEFELPGDILPDIIKSWSLLIHPDDVVNYLTSTQEILEHKTDEYKMEYRVKNRQHEYVWMHCHGKMICDSSGECALFVGALSRLVRKSRADMVTGLLNKYQFEIDVKAALDDCRNTGENGSMVIFGVDNFKIINETYNRFFGDLVLNRIGRKIENILPAGVKLYKLDGDEFAIIYSKAINVDVVDLFQSLQRYTNSQHELDNRKYLCTISAGSVFFPKDGKNYLSLHKHAEVALELAKQSGKNKLCFFSKETYNRWVKSIALRDELKVSVENGCKEFELFFQPQVDAVDRTLKGAEALLRWHNSRGKMVAPMNFIPLLEETKLIIPVGKWVFEEAVKVCKEWQALLPDITMSINVSYEQLKDVTFKEFVQDCMARYNIIPKSITLELTESCIVSDWEFVNQEFDFFRQQGVNIAMDDFGTGYSSLSYLKNLSTDIVKIDREFVKKILQNDFDKMLIEYTVKLCHSVGMTVCIEGVEEKEEYQLLIDQCKADTIQGYLFGRPVPKADFVQKFIIDQENLNVKVI